LNLQDVFNELNFYINKFTGSYYTIPELENITDIGQMGVYSDHKPKYAVSQLSKEILSPFRNTYNFTTQVSGYVIVPDATYLDLLDLQIYFQISNREVYYQPMAINEDTRADKLNSQEDPVTITSPAMEQTAPRTFRLYPTGTYNGNVTYLRRPIKPVFGYSIISGRVIVYNPNTSTQLEWRDTEIPLIIIKALEAAGINLRAEDVSAFAAAKSQGNYVNVNRL
jgi:hypothetical protein